MASQVIPSANAALRTLLGEALKAFTLRYPFYRGQSRILYSRAVHALYPAITGAGSKVRLRNGRSVTVLPQDENATELALFGMVEPGLVRVVRKLLEPGYTFLDIGANYGSISLLVADRVGSAGSIHLFEPQPALCSCIRSTLRQRLPCRFTLHEIALSDQDGELTFAVEPGHSGSGSLVRREESWSTFTVQSRDIASYLPGVVGEGPVGVKLDVEGAEGTLLPWLLRSRQVRFVAFEAGFLRDTAGIWELAHAQGFRMFGVRTTLARASLDPLPDPSRLDHYKDLVALREAE